MPGTLYVVATPIGNLEDVTLRALRILREVSVIAAEDTRRTSRLLQHYSISTPTTSLHAHNEAGKTPSLIARLQGGESIAVVSDAGTPVVSDPGARLIAAAHDAGLRVEPVPGPSAALAVISGSGFGGDGFVFAGFPPARMGARAEWLSNLASETRPVVLYAGTSSHSPDARGDAEYSWRSNRRARSRVDEDPRRIGYKTNFWSLADASARGRASTHWLSSHLSSPMNRTLRVRIRLLSMNSVD